MKQYITIAIIVSLSFLYLVGCSSTATIKHIETKEPIPVSPQEKSKPLILEKIVVDIGKNTDIGSIQQTLFCMSSTDLHWRDGRFDYSRQPLSIFTTVALSNIRVSNDDFKQVFLDETNKANYDIKLDKESLIYNPNYVHYEYLISGTIIEMQANLCFWQSTGEWLRKGEVYMKVDWTIISHSDEKNVYEIMTEGTSIVELKGKKSTETRIIAERSGMNDIFLNAFASATKNLLSDRTFHNLIVQ